MIAVSTPTVSRCECSANIARLLSQPCGLSDPFDSGQSGNAMPAPMLVVKAPRQTGMNAQAQPTAANPARAGWWTGGREEGVVESISGRTIPPEGPCCRPQTF